MRRAVLLMVVALAVAAPPSHAATLADVDVLYLSPQSGDSDSEIYLVGADGMSDERVLTEDGRDQLEAKLSPDGRFLASVELPPSEGQPILAVIDLATGARDVLATGVIERTLAWSPTGREIALIEQGQLRVIEVETGTSRTLGEARGNDGDEVHWSPSGQDLVLVEQIGIGPEDGSSFTSVVAADGSGRRPIGDTQVWYPDLSPAGGQLLYWSRDQLWLVSVDGSGARGLVAAPPTGAAWSPDGRLAAYAAAGGELWVVDVESGASCRSGDAGPDQGVGSPMWTGDGRWLVASSSTRGLVRVAPDDPSDGCDPDGEVVDLGTDLDTQLLQVRSIVHRLAATSRIGTAVEVSRSAFGAASTVVLATGGDVADALAGGPLAATLDGPLLLTVGDALPDDVADELTRLQTDRVVLLGGTSAIPASVEADLRARGLAVERVAGANRFSTAAAIAARVGGDRAYVVEGVTRFADGIAIGGLAGLEGAPVLLTTRDELPSASAEALGGMDQVTIVGGTAAVSADVEATIDEIAAAVDRLAGTDRYATSVLIADRAIEAGASAGTVWLATGEDWPDGLATGPAVAATASVLLLVDGGDRSDAGATRPWLTTHADDITGVRLVGGIGAITPGVAVSVERDVVR